MSSTPATPDRIDADALRQALTGFAQTEPDKTKLRKQALTLIKANRVLKVPDLEALIFRRRAYNTWSSASHVLGHLSYYGKIRLLEDGSGHHQEFE